MDGTERIGWRLRLHGAAVGVVYVACILIAAGVGRWRDGGDATWDVSWVILRAEALVEAGDQPWRGIWSSMPLGHPGPVLVWFVAAARAVGTWTTVGDARALLLATVWLYATCVLVAGWAMCRAMGTRAAGWVLAATYVTMAVVGGKGAMTGDGPHFPVGFNPFPLYLPSFASHLALATGALAVALTRPTINVAAAAVLFGGLTAQASLQVAPLGAAVATFAAIYLARQVWAATRPAHDRGERGERASVAAASFRRIWNGVGVGVLAVGAFAVGFGPLVGRVAAEGLDLIPQYVVETVRSRRRLAETMTVYAADMGFPALRAAWKFPFPAPAAFCLPFLLAATTWSRRDVRRAGIVAVVVAAFLTSQAFAGLAPYQASPAAAALPILLAAGAVHFRGGRTQTVAAAGAALIVVAGSWVAFGSLDQPRTAIAGSAAPGNVVSLVDHVAAGSEIALWSTLGDPQTAALDVTFLHEILTALHARGLNGCIPHSGWLYDDLGHYRCSTPDQQHVLVLVPVGEPFAGETVQFGYCGEYRYREMTVEVGYQEWFPVEPDVALLTVDPTVVFETPCP
jgi:hypothetical protein